MLKMVEKLHHNGNFKEMAIILTMANFLTSAAGYTQIIDKPTHIVNNSWSYIDLIYSTIQSLISKYGVDVSLFDKCYHNIIYDKTNTCVPLPPVVIHEG